MSDSSKGAGFVVHHVNVFYVRFSGNWQKKGVL